MLTISRAISAGQASNYYKQDFTNSQDNYYREAGEVQGRWCGTLAEEWNLKGEVTTEQYERLVAGQDPHTGEQLIRVVSARETVNKFRRRNHHQRASRRLGPDHQCPEIRFLSPGCRKGRACPRCPS
jgi:TrwC relaxase